MEIAEIRYVPNATTPWAKRRPTTSRIFFSFANETVLENLENRHGRPYNALRELIPAILEKAQMGPFRFYHDVAARWSQKAGCACGCSPGFILDGQLKGRELTDWATYDIHVTIK